MSNYWLFIVLLFNILYIVIFLRIDKTSKRNNKTSTKNNNNYYKLRLCADLCQPECLFLFNEPDTPPIDGYIRRVPKRCKRRDLQPTHLDRIDNVIAKVPYM